MSKARNRILAEDVSSLEDETEIPSCDEEVYYPPVKKGRGRPSRYYLRWSIGDRIVWALAHGYDTKFIIENTTDFDCARLTKQNIQYWKQLALDKGIIIEFPTDPDGEGLRYKYYGKGPNYHVFEKYKDSWQKNNFEPITCRVHCAGGDAIHVPVEKSALNEYLYFDDMNGEPQRLIIAPEFGRYNWEDSQQILIPFSVIGYHGAYATLHYRGYTVSRKLERLFISPPEQRLTIDQLNGERPLNECCPDSLALNPCQQGHQDDPFRYSVEYILSILKENDWRFSDWENNQPLHYAFDERTVKICYPALWQNVPSLSDVSSKDDTILYRDRSHGKPELETTDRGLAIEIATLLDYQRQRLCGERKYPSCAHVASTKFLRGEIRGQV